MNADIKKLKLPKVSVCSKTLFADEDSVDRWIEKYNRTKKAGGPTYRAYLCDRCFNWHLTTSATREMNILAGYVSQITNLKKKIENLKKQIADRDKKNFELRKINKVLSYYANGKDECN